ncbi:50S ribosomal protein L1 [Candidatus Falkowbacteria bacterium]|nr:50S ribosomal protein L1 [Candidatus Falkowbacteria bacterium]
MPKRRINNKKRDSKRFAQAKSKIDFSKTYSIADAVALAKETSTTKFDASVELHVNLDIDPKKGDQLIRGTVTLPHGTGKKIAICAIVPEQFQKEVKAAGATVVGGTELIDELAAGRKIDFDIVVTTPDFMKDMAKVAKVLGPKGIMPNPKTDTVSSNPAKTVEQLSKGKVSFKNDASAIVHAVVGKASFTPANLADNIEAFMDALNKSKPATVKGILVKSSYLTTSMGPSIKINA